MPCDSITRMMVDVGKMDVSRVHRALLSDADVSGVALSPCGKFITFRQNGLGHRYNSQTGIVEAWGRSDDSDEQKIATTATFKQGYSRETVKEQAKRFGWNLKQTGKNKFVVTKRF